MTGSLRRSQWLALGILLLGSVVNLAAGARRPLVERAILSGNHYPAADAAAHAVEAHVPAGTTVDLVVYDGDLLGELDCAVWADYRLKWLLYPRKVDVYRWSPTADLQPDPRYVEAGSQPVAPSGQDRYLLFFRVTAEPERSRGPLQMLARSRNFLLARQPAHAGARGHVLPRHSPPARSDPS